MKAKSEGKDIDAAPGLEEGLELLVIEKKSNNKFEFYIVIAKFIIFLVLRFSYSLFFISIGDIYICRERS